MIVIYRVSVGFAERSTGVRVNQVNTVPTILLFFESFRVGSAKPKLAGSIPALRTKT
jgi:hypothetical protein